MLVHEANNKVRQRDNLFVIQEKKANHLKQMNSEFSFDKSVSDNKSGSNNHSFIQSNTSEEEEKVDQSGYKY